MSAHVAPFVAGTDSSPPTNGYWYVLLDGISGSRIPHLVRGVENYFGRTVNHPVRVCLDADQRYSHRHAGGLFVDPVVSREQLEGVFRHFTERSYTGTRFTIQPF